MAIWLRSAPVRTADKPRRKVWIFLDKVSDEQHLEFVNELWARLPGTAAASVVLDSRTDLDAANDDYDARYRDVMRSSMRTDSDEQAERLLAESASGRRRSRPQHR